MKLDKFNLNLFVALDALLSTASLTEAARRLHLSQPALSISLKKLREAYGDELVVYGSGAPVLTAMGQTLKPRVASLIQAAKDTMKACPTFDPATSRQSFRLTAPDLLELGFLQSVIADVLSVAPQVQMTTQAFRFGGLASALGAGVDLAIVSDAFADTRYPAEPLFEEKFVCLVWTHHPHIGERMSAEAYLRARHVAMAYSEQDYPHTDRCEKLRRITSQQKISLRGSSHAALPHMVVGTDLVATTLSRYARWCAQRMPLRILPFPFDVPKVRYVAQWQPYREDDPALVWLRDRLQDGVRRMAADNADTVTAGRGATSPVAAMRA